MLWAMGMLWAYAGFGQAPVSGGFNLSPMESRLVPVTVGRMTTLVFPVDIETAVKVNKDVLTQWPRGVKNVLELQAARKEFLRTNLSVYGKDGQLYAFDVIYVDSPAVLSFSVVAAGVSGRVRYAGSPGSPLIWKRDMDSLAGLPSDWRRSASDGGFRLSVGHLVVKDSLVWIRVEVENRSAIPFRVDYLRVYLEDRKSVKRAAMQRRVLEPVYGQVPGVVGKREVLVMGYPLFAVGRGKRLVVEVGERDGGRGVKVRMNKKEGL
jgi:hypothetical protein